MHILLKYWLACHFILFSYFVLHAKRFFCYAFLFFLYLNIQFWINFRLNFYMHTFPPFLACRIMYVNCSSCCLYCCFPLFLAEIIGIARFDCHQCCNVAAYSDPHKMQWRGGLFSERFLAIRAVGLSDHLHCMLRVNELCFGPVLLSVNALLQYK